MDNNNSMQQLQSPLLELAACDDLTNFKLAVNKSRDLEIDHVSPWYTRNICSKKMKYEERTPLMVAAQYGSINVVDFIVGLFETRNVDSVFEVNRVTGSDRVTALHCAVAGGSPFSGAVIQSLVSFGADPNILDANGNRASDLISMLPKVPLKNSVKQLDTLLKPRFLDSDSSSSSGSVSDCDSDSKKEFAMSDLPDINNGIYGSDEFRMYCFKIKPCSRAYTHDWTECPFAHPGENARRRDPKKYPYACVPCPEFKKGSCKKGEECEFAHGVFESWLHPAQYKTRLCKDEIGCSRKVCFFAHRKEELRPVYASTGSALPDVSSGSTTPPMSPSFAPLSPNSGALGATGGGVYQGKSKFGGIPPNLQLPGSRLRSSLNARDVELEKELIKIETQLLNQQYQHHQQHQYLYQQMQSPKWNNNNLEQSLNSVNVGRKLSPPRALDSPQSVATTMLNSRANMFAKRSQSFIDRSGLSPMVSNLSSPISNPMLDWGTPSGKLDQGIYNEELNKLRKSSSFALRGANNNARTSPPDVSWVNSLVKDETSAGFLGAKKANYGQFSAKNGFKSQDMCSPWEQLYMEEHLVA